MSKLPLPNYVAKFPANQSDVAIFTALISYPHLVLIKSFSTKVIVTYEHTRSI